MAAHKASSTLSAQHYQYQLSNTRLRPAARPQAEVSALEAAKCEVIEAVNAVHAQMEAYGKMLEDADTAIEHQVTGPRF